MEFEANGLQKAGHDWSEPNGVIIASREQNPDLHFLGDLIIRRSEIADAESCFSFSFQESWETLVALSLRENDTSKSLIRYPFH